MIRRLLRAALVTVVCLVAPAPAKPPPELHAPALSLPISATPAAGGRRILVMLKMPPEHYRPGSDYVAIGGYGDPGAGQARRRLAARLAREQGLRLLENWPMPVLGVDCVVMEVPGNRSLEAVAERISHRPGVAWSQPLNEFTTQTAAAAAPNDRLFRAQPVAHAWKLAELHRLATGEGVKVAVIDSMIDSGHPDLRGRVATVRDFVEGRAAGPEQHGTGVAGIIGARANNGMGIAGVAPSAELIGLRACWQRSATVTVCDSLSLAKALTFAIENRADVINLSLNGPKDLLLARLIEAGLRRGASVVAAADPRSGGGFPASMRGVVAVAQDGLAAGQTGVYNAPGRDVPTTEPGGKWFLVSGNSYAAAHVSGLLALTRQLTAGKGSPPLVSARHDGGRIDACSTLLRAARRPGGCQKTR